LGGSSFFGVLTSGMGHVVGIPKRVLPSLVGSRATPYIIVDLKSKACLAPYIADRRSIRKKSTHQSRLKSRASIPPKGEAKESALTFRGLLRRCLAMTRRQGGRGRKSARVYPYRLAASGNPPPPLLPDGSLGEARKNTETGDKKGKLQDFPLTVFLLYLYYASEFFRSQTSGRAVVAEKCQ
jgi:hypothetical protein